MSISRKIIAGITAAVIAGSGTSAATAQSSDLFGSSSSVSQDVGSPKPQSDIEKLEAAYEDFYQRGGITLVSESETIAEEYAQRAVAGEFEFLPHRDDIYTPEARRSVTITTNDGLVIIQRDDRRRTLLLAAEIYFAYDPTSYGEQEYGLAVSGDDDYVYVVTYADNSQLQ